MRVLLIGGAPNTGKTNAIAMCANYLLGKGFNVINCQNYDGKKINLPKIVTGVNHSKDFLAVLEGKDLNNKTVSIVLTSASDTTGIIDLNFTYLQNQNYDIYISSIRDIGIERKYLLKKFNFTKATPDLLEFPLAKMSRRGNNWFTAKTWYDTTVQNVLCHLLESKPFSV